MGWGVGAGWVPAQVAGLGTRTLPCGNARSGGRIRAAAAEAGSPGGDSGGQGGLDAAETSLPVDARGPATGPAREEGQRRPSWASVGSLSEGITMSARRSTISFLRATYLPLRSKSAETIGTLFRIGTPER